MGNISEKLVRLSIDDGYKLLRLIRRRQDECKKVEFDSINYENMRQINDNLEVLKLNIAKQL